MKKLVQIALVLLSLAACSNQPPPPEPVPVEAPPLPASITTEEEQISYGLGYRIGASAALAQFKLDRGQFMRGLEEGLAETEPAIPPDKVEEAMTLFQKQFFLRQKEQRALEEQHDAALAEKNLEAAQRFLKQNAQKEGVVTLPSGLQYRILTPGRGAQPGIDDRVKVHYRGTLIDGTEFDSSIGNDKPAEFPVAHLVKGWKEGIQLMKEGGKWTFYIPPGLAYGPQRRGNVIGPNALLIFEVALIEVLEGPGPHSAPAIHMHDGRSGP